MQRTLLSLLVLLAAAATARAQTSNPEYIYPLIKGYGGIVALPDAAQPPRKDSKLVLDVISDEEAGDVLKAFEVTARIANLYAHAGVGLKEGTKLAVVLHGNATKAALSDDAYQKHIGPAENPNLPLLRKLRNAGVEIFVCGQALTHRNYQVGEVAPSARVAVSAASVNVNKQMEGYAYLPLH